MRADYLSKSLPHTDYADGADLLGYMHGIYGS